MDVGATNRSADFPRERQVPEPEREKRVQAGESICGPRLLSKSDSKLY